MAFTNWSDLADEVLDAIQSSANSNELKIKSATQPDGTTVVYNSLTDLINYYKKIKPLADAETSGRNVHRPIAITHQGFK